jgi:PAS domain S-box-containing protein
VASALANAVNVETGLEARRQSPKKPHKKEDVLLSRNAIMIRNGDGTIRYWSEGAQQLYGYRPDDALGMTSHRLLETIFPVPLEAIEEELRKKGFWEGQLIHKRRDGSKVTVLSHWDLQENPSSHDQSITIIEVNGPTKS